MSPFEVQPCPKNWKLALNNPINIFKLVRKSRHASILVSSSFPTAVSQFYPQTLCYILTTNIVMIKESPLEKDVWQAKDSKTKVTAIQFGKCILEFWFRSPPDQD